MGPYRGQILILCQIDYVILELKPASAVCFKVPTQRMTDSSFVSIRYELITD